MSKKFWERDLKMEDRALKNWMYRVGTLGGILAAWIMVGTGILTFVELSIGAVVLVLCLTMWDMRKMWKGK